MLKQTPLTVKRGMNASCGDEPAPVGIVIVVSPVEVEVAVGVDDREVGVVARIEPGSKRL